MFGLHSTLAHFIETAFVYISNIPKYIHHEIIRLYIIIFTLEVSLQNSII